jgi:serine/threonine protein kinase/tetratricopeptide (TPR) repeat protein
VRGDTKRVLDVFLAAIQSDDPAARAAVLERECSSSPELRRQVEALLSACDRSDVPPDLPSAGPSDRPVTGPRDASDVAPGDQANEFTIAYGSVPRVESNRGLAPESTVDRPTPSPTEGLGARIGPYKLLQKLGEGGMGAVFMAEQERPVRRRVALKIVKPGMDSEQVVARFEAERQALAMMDHRNIAHVFDAGMTETGRLYFVMELVHGVPITEYCDHARLATRERLELFIGVCQAIQHAHQKGIIHRDIKPSNILVTMYDGKPEPKVIDFGVAKATDQRLTERTMFTQYGAIVGTFEYMSPEQAEMSALGVDTRSDIYSLGVLLYELLTGTTPLERERLLGAGYAEILRRIKEEEPPPPSTRLSSSGARRALVAAQPEREPSKLSRLMRGELDWIVMKALEKDRTRRYESAGTFARDVQRFLDGDPVEACPPSAGYRMRKFASRHRAALGTAAGCVALLFVAAAVSTWQAVVATRARDEAAREARRALEAEEKANQERNKSFAAEAVARAEGQKSQRSAAEARAVLGFFQDHVLAAARPEGQEGGLGKDVSIRRAIDAAEPRIAAEFQGQPTAEASIRYVLGTTYYYLGEPALALRQHERAQELRKAELGHRHPDTLASQNNLALAYHAAGQLDRAVALFERTMADRIATLGPQHRDTLSTQNSLALALRALGRLDQAIALYERTLATQAAELGPDHLDTLSTQNSLALALRAAGRLDRAIPLFERTLASRTTRLGPDHPDTLWTQNSLALALREDGQLPRAIMLHERTLGVQRTKLGPDHYNTLITQNSLAMAYRDDGQLERAIALHEQTLATQEAKLGPGHPNALFTQSTLAVAYADDRQFDRAIPLLERTLAAREVRIGPDHPDTLSTRSRLGAAYQETGQLERSIAFHERTLAAQTAKLGPDHPDTLLTRNHLATAYDEAGEGALAEAQFRDVLERRRARLGPEHPDVAATLCDLGRNLVRCKRPAEAEPLLRECLAIYERKLPNHWRRFDAQDLLGASLLDQKQYEAAEPQLIAGYAGLKTREPGSPAQRKPRLSEAGDRLVRLYEAWEKPKEARKWRAKLDQLDLPTDVFARP